MTTISAPIKEETNKWSKSNLKPDIKAFDFGSGDSTTVLSLYKYIPSEDETKPFPYKLILLQRGNNFIHQNSNKER